MHNGLGNENDAIVGGNPYGAATFQNFIITGQTWRCRKPMATNNLSHSRPVERLLRNPQWRF